MPAAHIFEAPPPGAAADWTIPQDWQRFSGSEHATWTTLFEQQSAALGRHATRAFLRGLDVLALSRPGIPDYRELNARLGDSTGWQVVAVPGWIPNGPFFEHLANRRFPIANFLRPAKDLAYSEEPDMFHDLFGHVPTLVDPAFAEFLVAYGQAGQRAERLGAADFLGRLWLHTVEFGLVVDQGELRAYGGGLLSSSAETVSALGAPGVRRLWLDIERAMRTGYNFDTFQAGYFVVESFDQLLHLTETTDFAGIYGRIAGLPELRADQVAAGDRPYDAPSAAPSAGEAVRGKEVR